MSDHYFSESPTSREKLGLIRCKLRNHDLEFLTSSGVFSQKKIDAGTRLLIENMILPETGDMLDMGCGYGPIGITAAKSFPHLQVQMTDINERAVKRAKENVRRNKVYTVKVKQGNLYEPVSNTTFHAIVSNPPISAGMKKVIEPLVNGAHKHLTAGGSLQLVVQSNKGGRTLRAMMEKCFGNVQVIKRKGGYRTLLSKKKDQEKTSGK